MRGIADGLPVGKRMVEATVCLGGMSFHLTGPLSRVEDVAIGNGNPVPRVSWRKAKYRRVVAITSTPIRRIRGLIAAKIGIYSVQTICNTRRVINSCQRSSYEKLR
jgi:hypothetical protein